MPETRGAAVTSYEVYYWLNGEQTLFATTDLLTAELIGLELGKIYDFAVKALSEAGPGEISSQMPIMAVDVPKVEVVKTEASIEINWTYTGSVDGFEIQVRAADFEYYKISCDQDQSC